MGKFDNIVIASDMDGTFLGKNCELVCENIEKIKYFNQNGGKFTIITGRNYTTVFDPYPELADIVSAPVGLHNGACIYDIKNGSVVDDTPIDTELVIEMFRYLREFYPKVSTSLRCLTRFYFMPPDHASEWYKPFEYSIFDFSDCEEIRKLSVQKINFKCDETAYLSEVRSSIEKKYGDKIDCTTAEPTIVEIMPKGISKAIVIPRLRSLCKLENAKFFAIGDYENDLAMLRSADYAACPDNALETVKDICAIHVCHHFNGAIANLIDIIEEQYLG